MIADISDTPLSPAAAIFHDITTLRFIRYFHRRLPSLQISPHISFALFTFSIIDFSSPFMTTTKRICAIAFDARSRAFQFSRFSIEMLSLPLALASAAPTPSAGSRPPITWRSAGA